VILTGAASGIGAACAARFAEEGAEVLAVDLQAEMLSEHVRGITAAGGKAMVFVADVSKEADWERIRQEALTAFGKVDVLFNNAGIGFTGSVLKTTPADWDRVHSVNLRGVYLGCRSLLPHMIERGGGTIVNTASELGTVGGPEIAAYCAAKFGVVGLTKSIAIDFATKGIRANALCPGPVDTPLLRRDEAEAEGRPAGSNDTPMGRWGRPEELANAAVFLASDESSFMTGATLVVDGGLTAH
jgi:NAD(P)-dependent dehydrogenase (short-subunit alcohol dehydrogenase family)